MSVIEEDVQFLKSGGWVECDTPWNIVIFFSDGTMEELSKSLLCGFFLGGSEQMSVCTR